MRSRKKTALLFFVALAVTVMTVLSALHGRTQKDIASPKQEEPTPVQEGVMTEKQKKHSKMFKGFKEATGGKKLRDLITERGDVEVMIPVGDVQTPRSVNLSKYLQNISCEADVVVIGMVKNKASQLIEEGTFIFTDYEITATEILKNNPVAPIEPNNSITLTRSGGAVILNNHVVRAVDHRSEPLEVGKRYLLFLRFISDTGTYRPLGSSVKEDSFQLSGGSIIQVSEKPLPFKSQRVSPEAPFMSELRAVINNSCNNQGE
jgi:hypothetical protein